MSYLEGKCLVLRFRFGEVKRNKPLLVLVLPLIVAVFLVGWFMYVIGQDLASKGAEPKRLKVERWMEAVCVEQ